MTDTRPPSVLTIAGSDSSGGAGIEADLKTITVHGCYGMTTITGLTAQNTTGVNKIYPIEDQGFITACLDAVFTDVGVDVVKTGMLSSQETIATITSYLKKHHADKASVIDPVLCSTSGSTLFPVEYVSVYLELFGLATIVTPNIPEAVELASVLEKKTVETPKTVQDMKDLAISIHKTGAKWVLIKGGHLSFTKDKEPAKESDEEKVVIDLLYDGQNFTELVMPYITTKSTHGTGCTLASAIASNLALGKDVPKAVLEGTQYIQNAILAAHPIGKGHGPVNHTYNMRVLPFQKGHFLDYLLQHPKVAPYWKQYVEHPFVMQLAKGDLKPECYYYFLQQDYLYLRHYARAAALSGYKAKNIAQTAAAGVIIDTIQSELGLHIEHCKENGMTLEELENSEEGLQCYAYTRYLIDVGVAEDWLALQFATSPCLFGYGVAARNGLNHPEYKPGNRYSSWIDKYINPEFGCATDLGRELLETEAPKVSPERLEELIEIFATATKMEVTFWNKALTLGE